jgi:WD40 repeat protein
LASVGCGDEGKREESLTVLKQLILMSSLVWSMAILADEGAAPDFRRDVVPILRTYCLGCHSPTDKNGDFSMHTFADLSKGGEHGPALVPGKSVESRLYLMTSGKAEPKMPPEENPAPSEAQIELLRRWIDAGAVGPNDPNEAIVGDPVVPDIAPKTPPKARVLAAAWSPDGTRVALAGYRSVLVIDPATSYIEARLDGLAGMVSDVSFSADGQTIVTAGGVPGVRGESVLWNWVSGVKEKVFAGHNDALFSARLSPDRATLVTAGYDKTILVWEVASGSTRHELKGHNEAVHALAYRPGMPDVIASVSSDRTLKLWDQTSRERLDTLSESLKDLQSVLFSNDGAFVLAGGGDNRIRAWSVSSSAKEGSNTLVESRFAHEGVVLRLAMSPAGNQLASAGSDLLVKLWQWPGVKEERVLEKQSDWPSAVVYSPKGDDLLIARQDGTVSIYDPANGSKKRDLVPTVKPPPPPVIVRVLPAPATIGQTTRVVITGANLSASPQVKLSHAGLSATILSDPPVKNDSITLDLTAAADLPLGRHELRIVTAGGESSPLPIEADTLASTEELESSDDAQSPMEVSTPTQVWGTLSTAGDADQFSFSAEAGHEFVLDANARRIGSSANVVVSVIDGAGRVLASNNDYLGDADSFLVWEAPHDGKFVAQIHDRAFQGSAKHYYRLTIGRIPYVTGIHPLSIPVGSESKISLTGPNVPADATVSVKGEQAGEVGLPIDGRSLRNRRAMSVAAALATAVEVEPNDQIAHASPMTAPGEAAGRIERAGDEDYFAVELVKDQPWIFEIDSARRGWDVDTRIDVFNADGSPIERMWLVATRDSYVEFRGIDSAQLEIRCKSWQEMELNQYLYMNGEVGKLFRHPRGPDSGFLFYSVAGQRRTYFDTSSSTHALEDPVYIVEPVAPGTSVVPNGLPIFKLTYSNDDGSDRRLKGDSQIFFTPPTNGRYLIRVVDVRGEGSPEMPYRLIARRPAPDFFVSIDDRRPTLHKGSGREVVFRVDRRDGFEGNIDISVLGLPAGLSISQPIQIEAGHEVASAVMTAAPDAPTPTAEAWSQVKVLARAMIDVSPIEKPVPAWEAIGLADHPPIKVRIEPGQIVLAPGGTVAAKLIIERTGHQDQVTFEMLGLPHGVIVDNIGLNGILIPKGETEREFFLNARPFVEQTDRPFFARSNEVGAQASGPVILSIRRPSQVASGPAP